MREESQQIKEPDAVALLEDLPEHGRRRGEIGTAMDELAPGIYDVEFCDELGRTIVLTPLPAEKLMVLHHAMANAI